MDNIIVHDPLAGRMPSLASQALYVALSRVRNREDAVLDFDITNAHESKFCHKKQLHDELDRLNAMDKERRAHEQCLSTLCVPAQEEKRKEARMRVIDAYDDHNKHMYQ